MAQIIELEMPRENILKIRSRIDFEANTFNLMVSLREPKANISAKG